MLSITDKKEAMKGVTVYLSSHPNSYLTLYGLAKSKHKAKILRELISAWIIEQRLKESEAQLMRQIAIRINSQWMASKILNPLISFLEFKEIIRRDLFEKGISPNNIEQILKGVKEDVKKNK